MQLPEAVIADARDHIARAREHLWRAQTTKALDTARAACDLLAEAAQSAQRTGTLPPPELAEAWAVLALAYAARSLPSEGLEATDFILSLPQASVSDLARCDLWLARCKCNNKLGLLSEALNAADQAIRAAEAYGDIAAQARAHEGVARYAKSIEDYGDALRSLKHSRELAESVGAGDEISMTIINTVDVWGRRATASKEAGDDAGFEQALRSMQPLLAEVFERAAIDREISPAFYAFAIANLADVHILVGNQQEAQRLVNIYGDMAREHFVERLPAYSNVDLARLAIERGDPAEAVRVLTSDRHQREVAGEDDLNVITQDILYRAYKLLGDYKSALDYLEKYTEHDIKRLEVRAEQRTRVLLARFDTEKAEAAAKAARMDAELNRLQADMMERQAREDVLTGLGNRRACDEALDRALTDLRRQQQRRADDQRGLAMSLAILDVDHFKAINDTYGHDAGDIVLKQIAQVTAGTLREDDRAYRYGGEEFVLVFINDSLDLARAACERVRGALEAHDWAAALNLPGFEGVTASFGVAQWDGVEDKAALLRRTDRALYRAKQGGRNRVVVAS